MTTVRQNIPLTEPWTRTSWKNFDSYQPLTSTTALGEQASASYPFGLTTQNHINLRNFDNVENWQTAGVGELLPVEGLFPNAQLFPGGALAASGAISTLPSATYNNWPMATVHCDPGSNVYVNVIAESIYLPVDITTIGSESALTIALPSFPLSSIDLTHSFLAFSSDGFVSNQILTYWGDSTTTPINGHSTLTWPYSAIAGNVDNVDLTKINGIMIFITATATVDVRFMALRIIDNNWVQTDVDFNTLTRKLTQCIPLNGDPTAVVIDSNKTVPILWRSADVPGVDDPQPINAEISAEFNTGTALNSLNQSQAPQGNWIGTYGQDGYLLAAYTGGGGPDVYNLPHFSSMSSSGAKIEWAASTTDARALIDPTGSFRKAETYYSNTSFTIQFIAQQDYHGTMNIYCVDYDSQSRIQTLSCQGQTANLSSFVNGAWVTFAVSVAQGRTLTLTVTNNGGPNAVVSGIFFGGGPQVNGSCAIYMRGQSSAFISMLDLKGTAMQDLSGRRQPSLGVSTVAPRTMADLERYDEGQLDIQTMRNMEAMQDIVTVSWIKFMVQWGANPIVQVTSSNDLSGGSGGYIFTDLRLASSTDYLMVCNLTDTTTRMYVYRLDPVTKAIQNLVYDTTLIPDSNEFPRYRGRIGLQASLENDAFVGPVRPRGLMFAEYRSAALNSITPVSGAQLYVGQTPDTQLWQDWTPFADQSGNEPTLSADSNRSTTGSSTAVKVINTSTTAPQGIESNWLTPADDDVSGVTNFNEAVIELDLWFPSGGFQFATQNLCPDPSFEHDANSVAPFGWSTPIFSNGGTTSTFLVQEGWANKGSNSLRITGTGMGASSSMHFNLKNPVPASPGLAYSTEMVFKVLSSSTTAQVGMNFYDKNGVLLGTGSTNNSPAFAGIYTLHLDHQIAPPNTAFVNIVSALVGTGSVDGYLDTVLLVQATTLPTYFDGDTPGYTWAGAPGQSMSVTGQPLVMELVSEDGAIYALDIPKLISDQWQHIELDSSIAIPSPQSGKYKLVINYYGLPTTWWIDGTKIAERSVTWSGRSVTSDASNSNYAPWTAFRELINSDSDGIRFSTQGSQLQVKGQALKQNAIVLDAPKVVPRYAQLGRFAWPEDKNAPIYQTTSVITTKSPTSATDNSLVGTVAWSNVSNITAQDGSYASFTSSTNNDVSHYLMASNFGFTIPGTSIICGIVVTLYRYATQNMFTSTTGIGNNLGGIYDGYVQLLDSGSPITTNRARTPSSYLSGWPGLTDDFTSLQNSTNFRWPIAVAPITYGDPNDLWNHHWLPSTLSNSNFGVAIGGQVYTGAGISQTGNVDYVAITVYYQPANVTSYAPVPLVTSTSSGRAYTFNGNLSSSATGTNVGTWYWSFGDDTFDSGPTVIHTYTQPGVYTVTLTVTDHFGFVNTGSQVVEVS